MLAWLFSIYTGQYSATLLGVLFFCVAVYCAPKLGGRSNRSRWLAHFVLALVGMVGSIFTAVCLATHPQMFLSGGPASAALWFAAAGVAVTGAGCVVFEAFALLRLRLAWLRIAGALTMLTMSYWRWSRTLCIPLRRSTVLPRCPRRCCEAPRSP